MLEEKPVGSHVPIGIFTYLSAQDTFEKRVKTRAEMLLYDITVARNIAESLMKLCYKLCVLRYFIL